MSALNHRLSHREVLEAVVIDTLLHADLAPLEVAEGYRRLAQQFHYTQDHIARTLGRSRSQVANTLRLLNLPPAVKQMLREGKLSAGHARALLNANRPQALAERVVAHGLSVREAERLARKAPSSGSTGRAAKPARDGEAVRKSAAFDGDATPSQGGPRTVDNRRSAPQPRVEALDPQTKAPDGHTASADGAAAQGFAEHLTQARREADRLRALVSALCFSPLRDGVRSRADALYVLGFPPNGRPDARAVKEKYRLLARIHHPDSGFGNHPRMCQLNQAATLLGTTLSARPAVRPR
jgi:hypothetical protein